MNRESDSITEMVAKIEQNLKESKEYQFFGGDALIVNELDEALADSNNVNYTLTLTPENETGVLPSGVELRWTNTNISEQSIETYSVRPVYRDDGVFEWVIKGGTYYGWTTYISLQWIGRGTATLTRIN